MKNLKANNGVTIQGFIEYELVSTKDNIKRVYKNTITNAGKQLFLSKSAGDMLGGNPNMFGDTLVSQMFLKHGVKYGSNSYEGFTGRYGRSDRDITNVLLNLDENVLAGLGGGTSFINPWNGEFTENTHIVGYANTNINPVTDGKEGVPVDCKGEYLVDPFTLAKRWKYAEGVATGSINCIGMMPASVVKQYNGDGLKFSKLIDQVNFQATNYVGMSTGFLIPGVPGYTSNNEVLLNFERDGNSKWKYNIGTGEITAVPSTDNFWVYTGSNTCDMQYIDGYLYVLECSYSTSTQYIYLKVYDPANGMNEVKSLSLPYKNSGAEYKTSAKIFKYADSLYVSVISDFNPSATIALTKLIKLKLTNGIVSGTDGSVMSDFSSIGTLPSGLDLNRCMIGRYGENYVLFNMVKTYSNLNSTTPEEAALHGRKMVGYVFTNMENIGGSIIDMIPGLTPNEVLFSSGSYKGTLRVGFDYYNTSTPAYSLNYDMSDSNMVVMNNNNKDNNNSIFDRKKVGVYMTLDKWWTNIISFAKLNTPIEKTDTDILYVSYGYKIV